MLKSVRKQIIVFWACALNEGESTAYRNALIGKVSRFGDFFFLTLDDSGGGAPRSVGVASLIHEKARTKMKILTIFEEPTKIT